MQTLNEFGLPERTTRTLRDTFSRFPEIERVIVYGSRAMGNYREGSDIDLTIVADGPFDKASHVWGMLDDSDIPYLVDVRDFAALQKPDLVDHIRRRGKVIYERGRQV